MKTILAVTAAIAAIAAAAPAAAQVSGSIGYSRFDTDGADDIDAVTGRIGWNQGFFGVEGEASVGVNDKDVNLKRDIGIYARVQAPINENLNVFGRVGYGSTKVGSVAGNFSEESVRYGVGAEYFFDGQNGVRGDWQRHDFDEGDIDSWSISYVRRF